MKYYLFILIFFAFTNSIAQKYVIDKSEITFFSDAAIEDIKAKNQKASGIFNTATSDIVFSIPINEFQFEKSLMQEHFNEKYLESDKYPKATFQGKISGFDANASGPQQASAKGKLTIHGVTNEVEIPGSIDQKDKKFVLNTKFMVKLVDYKITIPQLLWQNIAEQIEVTCEFTFKAQ